jgi:hypothetical protein
MESKPAKPKFKSKSMVSLQDQEIAQKLAEQSAILYSSFDKPKRVTINFLIRCVSWNPYIQNKYIFPEAMHVLKGLPESDWYFYARRIIWAKLAYKYASDPVVRRKSGIEHLRAVVLMDFFKDVDLSVPLNLGVVTGLLTDRGIYRDWVGPCPEREFPVTGRRFYQNR